MNQLAGSQQQHSKLFGLDHLRALAITLVFFFHYGGIFGHPEWVNNFFKFGWTGVDLFFVLSGFLIASSLFSSVAAGKPIPIRLFYIKRFFRIIPPYLFVLCIYFLLPSFREREALAPLWRYISFTQNIGLDLRTEGTFSHAWSLCIEEQFYLLLPLLLLLLQYTRTIKKAAIILLLLFVAGFLIRIYCWGNLTATHGESDDFGIYWYKWIYYPTWCRLDGLLVGVSIAALYQFKPAIQKWTARYNIYFLLGGLAVLTGAYFLCEDEHSFEASIFGFPLIAIGYGCLVMAATSPGNFFYRNASSITSFIARISYSLYLTHKIVIHVTQVQFSKWGIQTDGNLMLVICVLTSLLFAWLLHIAIERPYLNRKHRLT